MSARTDAEAQVTQSETGITPDALSASLKERLEASHVDISDLSGKQWDCTNLHEGRSVR